MKKLYDALKYVIYGSVYVIALKTGFDFYSYKRYPDICAAYSAPWYTEALLYGILSFAVIMACVIVRIIIFRKLAKDTEQVTQ